MAEATGLLDRRGRRPAQRRRPTAARSAASRRASATSRGLDPALHLPRRATPRTRVPAGAVAIAAEYTRRLPVARRPAAGTSSAAPTPRSGTPAAIRRLARARARPSASSPRERRSLVVDAGWATTIQDPGRPGHAHLGVPPSGAARRRRARRSSTGWSATTTTPPCSRRPAGCALRATGRRRGRGLDGGGRRARSAPARSSTVDRRPDDRCGATSPCAAASTSHPCSGRAARTRARGSVRHAVGAGERAAGRRRPRHADRRRPGAAADGRRARCRCGPGPRLDWFAAGALDDARRRDVDGVAATSAASASASTARRCRAAIDAELPSEGLVTGAVQVPPDGQPVVMLADHPTTGGYPVIAVVDPARHRRWSGQARPGSTPALPCPALNAAGHKPPGNS